VDVATATAPNVVGSATRWPSPWGVGISGSTVYLGTGRDFAVYDITDPASPMLVGQGGGEASAIVVVDGNRVYAGGNSRLLVIDVSDPSSPAALGMYPLRGSATIGFIESGVAYIGQENGGRLPWRDLAIVDISAPELPPWPDLGRHRQVFDLSYDGLALHLAADEGLVVYAPVQGKLSEVSRMDATGRSAAALAVLGGKAFVGGQNALDVFSVVAPASPQSLGSVTLPERPSRIAALGDNVFVADYAGGLRIIDVSGTPTEVGSLPFPERASSVRAAAGYAYVGTVDGHVVTVDISNPAAPSRISDVSTIGQIYDFEIEGSVAYAATSGVGFATLDLTQPEAPTIQKELRTVNGARDIHLTTNEIWIADDDAGLLIYDRLTAEPALLGSYYLGANAWALTVIDDEAFVGTLGGGVKRVERLTGSLSHDHTLATPSTTLTYQLIDWDQHEAACTVTGGLCSVSGTTVEWTLPAMAGDYEIAVARGKHAYFDVVARDRVAVRL
jgi:hypothetical protein